GVQEACGWGRVGWGAVAHCDGARVEGGRLEWVRLVGSGAGKGAWQVPSTTKFQHTEVLPLGKDTTTEYRLVTDQGVEVVEAAGRKFLRIEPEALTTLARTAITDIQHLLRTSHLAQLRAIVDDPEASGNDRYVAMDLLRNAAISAGGVLPMCQD